VQQVSLDVPFLSIRRVSALAAPLKSDIKIATLFAPL